MSAILKTNSDFYDGLVQRPEGRLQSGRVHLDAPAAAAWEIVGDFAGFSQFITGLERTEMTGSGVRSVRKKFFGDGNLVLEQLNTHDAGAMVMTWSLLFTTFNIANLWARMSVQPRGARQCEVLWEIAGDPVTGSRADFEAFIDGFLAMAMGNLDKKFNKA